MDFQLLMGVATGVILFLYGIDSFTREVKVVAGEELRRILAKWTRFQVLGMTLGATITALIQSSTATSVLTLSLVNSAIINFRQSIGIILGTNIGTTVTAFLVAYKLTAIGPWFIVGGFLLSVIRGKYSFIGKALFYFGLVFFALSQLSTITTPLKNDPFFASILLDLNNPFYGILAGCVITTIIQSSSVTTGLVVILVQSSALTLGDAIPIILGANIGTTFTGILASLSMDTFAKRATAVNTIFNIGGVVLFFPFLTPFTNFVMSLGGTPAEMTAMAHLLFNVIASLFFLFLVRPLEWIATWLIKSDEHEIVFEAQHIPADLDENIHSHITHVELEIAHHLQVARSMLQAVVSYIDLRTKKGLERLEKFTLYSRYLSKACETAVHQLALRKPSKEEMEKLILLIRMSDFVRQSVASQRQIADIPELMRLPDAEEVTGLKAEIFHFTSLFAQYYEHLQKLIETHDEKQLSNLESINQKLMQKINDAYGDSISFTEGSSERIRSFYINYLIKMQSVNTKLREVRKLATAFAGIPTRANQPTPLDPAS